MKKPLFSLYEEKCTRERTDTQTHVQGEEDSLSRCLSKVQGKTLSLTLLVENIQTTSVLKSVGAAPTPLDFPAPGGKRNAEGRS